MELIQRNDSRRAGIDSVLAGENIIAKARDYRIGGSRSSSLTPYAWGAASYSIPVSVLQAGAESECDAEQIARLQRIVSDVGCRDIPLDGYLQHRADWLAANIRLNISGRLSPRFRPTLDPRQVPATLAQGMFACDRQVIDLHWLHCTGIRMPVQQAEFGRLLTDEAFDFEVAASFAHASVTVERKVENWLALAPCVQWQLAGLQCAAIRKRWATLRWGEGRGTPGLVHVTAALCAGRIAQSTAAVQELSTRWMIEKMLPGASASVRARLFAVARGLPREPAPHVFQRQQTAALRRVAAALN